MPIVRHIQLSRAEPSPEGSVTEETPAAEEAAPAVEEAPVAEPEVAAAEPEVAAEVAPEAPAAEEPAEEEEASGEGMMTEFCRYSFFFLN